MQPRGLVATEVAARGDGLRGFVAVIPRPGAGYPVFQFDVPARALAEERYRAPEQIPNSEQRSADTVEGAEQVLSRDGSGPRHTWPTAAPVDWY